MGSWSQIADYVGTREVEQVKNFSKTSKARNFRVKAVRRSSMMSIMQDIIEATGANSPGLAKSWLSGPQQIMMMSKEVI